MNAKFVRYDSAPLGALALILATHYVRYLPAKIYMVPLYIRQGIRLSHDIAFAYVSQHYIKSPRGTVVCSCLASRCDPSPRVKVLVSTYLDYPSLNVKGGSVIPFTYPIYMV